MQDQIEYFVQPCTAGMRNGPVIRIHATTPIRAVGAVLKEQLVDHGKLGQLRAYVSYFGDDNRHHRVRYYRTLVD